MEPLEVPGQEEEVIVSAQVGDASVAIRGYAVRRNEGNGAISGRFHFDDVLQAVQRLAPATDLTSDDVVTVNFFISDLRQILTESRKTQAAQNN